MESISWQTAPPGPGGGQSSSRTCGRPRTLPGDGRVAARKGAGGLFPRRLRRADAYDPHSRPTRWREILPLKQRRFPCARGRAIEEELALACVACERCRVLELRPGLVEAAEPYEEVGADTRQEMVLLE